MRNKVVSPGRERFDNRKKFFVVNIVIGFGRKELAGEKGARVHNSVVGNLGEDTSTSEVRSIALDNCGAGEIEMS